MNLMAAVLLLAIRLAEPLPLAAPEARLVPAWQAGVGDARSATLVALHRVEPLLLVEDSLYGVTAFDPRTGKVRWFVQHDGPLDLPPVASAEGVLTLASLTHLIVVELATGRKLYDGRVTAVPALSPLSDGRALYIPSLVRHRVVTLDLRNGLESWHIAMPQAFTGTSLQVGDGLVVGCADGTVRSISMQLLGGSQRWRVHTGRTTGALVAHRGRVLLSAGHSVLALEGESGRALWRRTMPSALTSGPVVVTTLGAADPSAADAVIAVAGGSELYGLAAASGEPLWTVEEAAPRGAAFGLLLTAEPDGSCALREPLTGAKVAAALPGDLRAAGPVLVHIPDGRSVTAWQLSR